NDLARRLPRCAYYPFVDGPRICIGMHFAMMEAVLILATVASRYRLQLAPGYKLKIVPSVTIRPQGGVSAILHDRKASAAAPPPAAAQHLAASDNSRGTEGP